MLQRLRLGQEVAKPPHPAAPSPCSCPPRSRTRAGRGPAPWSAPCPCPRRRRPAQHRCCWRVDGGQTAGERAIHCHVRSSPRLCPPLHRRHPRKSQAQGAQQQQQHQPSPRLNAAAQHRTCTARLNSRGDALASSGPGTGHSWVDAIAVRKRENKDGDDREGRHRTSPPPPNGLRSAAQRAISMRLNTWNAAER